MNDAPTLVVDIGGTLLRRTLPGAFGRTLHWLAGIGFDATHAAERLAIAQAVLTRPDPATAAAEVVCRLGLDGAARAALADVLAAPDGTAVIVDGAETLLAAARQLGWRVIAATNAARWAAPLPGVIAHHCDQVLSSSDVGLVKQQQAFWEMLVVTVGLDRRRTLVIGDDVAADVEPARLAGLASIHVDHATVTPSMLVSAFLAAGPAPSDAVGLVAGLACLWAGRWVTVAPHLTLLLGTVTRARVLLQTGDRVEPATVVRRQNQLPAVCCDDPKERPPFLAWVRVRPNQRRTACPGDLATALSAAGLLLDDLPERDQRHLVSLVREAKDPAVRAARIVDIVNHLHDKAGTDPVFDQFSGNSGGATVSVELNESQSIGLGKDNGGKT